MHLCMNIKYLIVFNYFNNLHLIPQRNETVKTEAHFLYMYHLCTFFNNKVNKRQYCMNLAVFRPFAINLFIIRASLGANLWLIQFIRQDIERLSSVLIWNVVMGLMAVNVYE